MKNSYVVVLVLGAVAATAGIQEWRLGGERLQTAANLSPDLSRKKVGPVSSSELVPDRERHLTRVNDGTAEDEGVRKGFSKSIRKMWENPAGKSMMSQSVKVAVAMMYEDYIETLDLTDEETKHFRELLGTEMATQQEIGMRMMDATPEERKALAEEMAERNKETEESIKTFLNNDEDFEAYLFYKERMPERQQLEGIRATMSTRNAPMDEAAESQLIDAMHRVRTQPGLADFSGKNAMFEMGKGDMVARFEESWERQQAMLRDEVDFLSELQKEALFEHQEQMKEFQMMGLKMAEQMMEPEEE